MKIVCVCQRGNVRSTALAYLLKDYHGGQDAIAIGWQTAGVELQRFLFEWSERIFVLESYIEQKIPVEYRPKVFVFDVGPDVYGDAKNTVLLNKLEDLLRKLNWK